MLLAARAHAHSQPYSWVELRVEGPLAHGSATAHVVDLAHVAGLASPESLRSDPFLAAHRAALLAEFGRALDLESERGRIAVEFLTLATDPGRNAVRATFECPVAGLADVTLARRLFTWEDVHETYFNVYVDGKLRHQDLLDSGHTRSTYATGRAPGFWPVAARFVREGVHHIFIGPDHILFIIGLILLGGTVRRLTRIVTGFTLAHSATLALATLGIVNLPSRLVEPLIALSIVVVGIENLTHQDGARDHRTWLAFGFGFVHGFGFASVLRELELPRAALGVALVSFNVGVELGQMAIVLAVAPLLGLLRGRRPAIGRRAVVWGSATVIAAGSFWFVQRVFFAS